MPDAIDPPPTATAVDRATGIARALVGEFPGGSVLVGLVEQIFGTALARRHEDWLRRVWELLVELDSRGVDIGALGDRPEFLTAIRDATRIAAGEHLAEKLDMLKAVLLNSALHEPDPIVDLWTLRYLQWVDELEPAHVAILAFGTDPRGWLEERGIEMPDYLSGPRHTVFELGRWPYPPDVIALVFEDLDRLRLGGPGSGIVTGGAMYDAWTSARGRRFLDWLTIV